MSEQIDLANPADVQANPPGEATFALGRPRNPSAPTPDGVAAPTFPHAGESLFCFRLHRELGRGSFARVFQAEQTELAQRPVVLKISQIAGNEAQTLAQLQHTHIVPIYSVHEDARLGLRAVCMPYFGGASLSSVLTQLWSSPAPPTSGVQLKQALATVVAAPAEEAGEGILFAPWEKLDYAQAIAWITAHLADALQHAHQRGVLHRDIKPSNILLAADGQPMLLDFNVADQEGGKAGLGGTVAYMSPEHLRAVASRTPDFTRQVDRRSDVYSLGMTLFEMLAGDRPFEESGSYSVELPQLAAMAVERGEASPSIRQHRPDTPWNLESILRHCLAPVPEQRYQQAEHLAEDLRCFLENRPLKYAPELSRAEQARKWMRRHPRLTSSASVATAAALVLLAVTAALFGAQNHLTRVERELQVARAEERWHAYEEGTIRALCLINTTTGGSENLQQGLTVCEKTLALYGVLDDADWQHQADRTLLSAGQRQQLAEDTRELLLLLAWGRARNAPGDRHVLQDNLALLQRAEAIAGVPPSRALWQDRALYLTQLEDASAALLATQKAEAIQPTTARDHYELAISYAREGKYTHSIAELDCALQLNPRHYWSSLQRGVCHLELGKHPLATADFSVCIGLWPDLPWGHFNRGYCLEKSGFRAEAIADYSNALERDPGFVLAYQNRGMAHLELRTYGPALADLTQAVQRGRPSASLLAGIGAAQEGLHHFQQADEAFQQACTLAVREGEEIQTRIHSVYGFAVSARLPDRALAAFDAVLKLHPQHARALYGRAMLLVGKGREDEAIRLFTRAVEASPSFVEARRYRGVLLARSGRFAEASQDVNWCLEKEPDAGATCYAAACVAALAVAKTSDRTQSLQAADQSLHFLRLAFKHNYGREQAESDADLQGVHHHPEFLRLLASRPRAAVPR